MGRIADLCGEVAAAADEGPDGLILPVEAWDRLRADWSDEDIEDALAFVRDNRIRAIAVTSAARNPALPDVPTLAETVMPGYHILAWAGMFGPAGMPPEAVKTLAGAIETALNKPELRQRFTSSGTDIYWSGPQDFDAFVKSELVSWTAMIKEAGIEPE